MMRQELQRLNKILKERTYQVEDMKNLLKDKQLQQAETMKKMKDLQMKLVGVTASGSVAGVSGDNGKDVEMMKKQID